MICARVRTVGPCPGRAAGLTGPVRCPSRGGSAQVVHARFGQHANSTRDGRGQALSQAGVGDLDGMDDQAPGAPVEPGSQGHCVTQTQPVRAGAHTCAGWEAGTMDLHPVRAARSTGNGAGSVDHHGQRRMVPHGDQPGGISVADVQPRPDRWALAIRKPSEASDHYPPDGVVTSERVADPDHADPGRLGEWGRLHRVTLAGRVASGRARRRRGGSNGWQVAAVGVFRNVASVDWRLIPVRLARQLIRLSAVRGGSVRDRRARETSMADTFRTAVIDKEGMDALIRVLATGGRTVIGPMVRDGAVVLSELQGEEDPALRLGCRTGGRDVSARAAP